MRQILMAAMLVVLTGCAALENRDARLELAVKYSTLKTIERAELTGEQVVDGVQRLRPLVVDGGPITLAALAGQVREAVRWDRLSPADQLLLDAVLMAVEAELQARLGEGLLNAGDRAAIGVLLDWIEQAAALG